MNKAERNSFGQSGQPKKLQAPAKRRELAKKMSRAIERKKGKLYNIKDRERSKPMSEFMKEGRATTNPKVS